MTTTWKINAIEYDTAPNDDGLEEVITNAHYDVLASDRRGNVGRVYGSVGLDAPDPASFRPRPTATEADIIGWLKAKFGVWNVMQLETAAEDDLERRADPPRRTVSFDADGKQLG